MARKRGWPDHVSVGLVCSIDGVKYLIVDAKCGPMTFDPRDLEGKDIVLHGTIKLRVKPVAGGAERWMPPMDGKTLCDWAEQERSKPDGR